MPLSVSFPIALSRWACRTMTNVLLERGSTIVLRREFLEHLLRSHRGSLTRGFALPRSLVRELTRFQIVGQIRRKQDFLDVRVNPRIENGESDLESGEKISR